MDTQTNERSLSVTEQLHTWPMAILLGMGVALILLMQGVWGFISGLYFPYAYETIVIPYTMYSLFSLYRYANGAIINKTKHQLLIVSFAFLFLPSIFLLLTGQVDGHTAMFGEFDPTLNHLPYAHLLPVVFLGILIAPIRNLYCRKQHALQTWT
ncbi:hypothetical protein HNW13_017500 [Shewanella sp. BF02_Schw]|uniref:hypothetical protein n=1 Tax=Shewanella sp. BF02_Schw TaxID=394908 RepID=UPI001781EDC2|nr:hypothetical protein [Shewanella sp. BF02_Schw]MBO1897535.1 hypothetical protein [Shewanella sp. BF02_Schw]